MEKDIEQLTADIDAAFDRLGLLDKEKQIQKLEAQVADPSVWQIPEQATALSQELAGLKKIVEPWLALQKEVQDTAELIRMGDDSLTGEIEKQITVLRSRYDELAITLHFSGPYDSRSVVLSLMAGAGGTDAQDWAEMLLRMYSRWAEKHRLKTEIIEQTPGDEAGIKSATLSLSGGEYLYGKLKHEHGVHRLVRLSPFNSAASRETSFARVEVLPHIDTPSEVEIDEKDLKIDVYRSGGHGGQSVNTTDSAVRITHLPTGIVVAIQNERSQLQNKETALRILRSRLAQLQLEQHQEKVSELKGPAKEAAWGNQIRNYVMHPYRLVKDTRSGYETSDVDGVLNGDIDGLIEAGLGADGAAV